MLNKTLSLLLSLLTINMAAASSFAGSQVRFEDKVKANISKLGTGENVHVEVKLHDKTTLKGYVKEIGSESFLLADAATHSVTTVQFPQVKKFKAYNMSTGAKVALGLGIAAAALFFLLYIAVD